MPDAELGALINECVQEVRNRQQGLAAALLTVANRAREDADAAVTVAPEALTLSYFAAHETARQVRQHLLEARDRLAEAATERNRREGII